MASHLRAELRMLDADKNLYERLGKFIRDARKQRGITQTELADRMNVPRPTIANMEETEL